jgi:phage terminase small subunit
VAKLTDKQRLFVEHYLQCWNATEAARRAGYRHPNKVGPRNLVKVGIREIIGQRLQAMAMDADEVLAHLASIARGSAADIVQTDAGPQGVIDLAKAEKSGALHLVKKLEWTKGYLRVEFYDRLEALELLGKAHRLFVDRKEHSGPDGGPIQHAATVTIFIPENERDDRDPTAAGATDPVPGDTS